MTACAMVSAGLWSAIMFSFTLAASAPAISATGVIAADAQSSSTELIVQLVPDKPQPFDQRERIMTGALACMNKRVRMMANRHDPIGESAKASGDRTAPVPVILTRQGPDRIIATINGKIDLALVKRLLTRPMKLTFHNAILAGNNSLDNKREDRKTPPPGFSLMRGPADQNYDYLVKRKPLLAEGHIINAQPGFDRNTHAPLIRIRLDHESAHKFGHATSQLVGKAIAVVLDGRILTAPVVMEPIWGGVIQINGDWTTGQVSEIAAMLQSCTLPAPFKLVAEKAVEKK